MERPELSVVVPVYNCADCVTQLYERLVRVLADLVDGYEIVFVDDRSPDAAWAAMRAIAERDSAVKVIRLSRNFGQSVAVTAGLAQSTGEWTVIMDCDLQDRPEDIPRLLEKASEGYDIVFSRRTNRRQSLFRRLAARAYFRLRNLLLKVNIDREHGSLMLVSRQVVGAFLRVRDRDRHHVLILYWLGFDATVVELEHSERLAGRSSYSFSKLVSVAVDGLFFQTTILLRWIVYLGFFVALLGLLLAAFLLVVYFVVEPYPGWTSLAVLILITGGFIIMSTGIAGLYVGKIFEQVKDRPLYVVERSVVEGVEHVGEPELAPPRAGAVT